jgi:uncharacterized protein YjbI with pentapeptide repeats
MRWSAWPATLRGTTHGNGSPGCVRPRALPRELWPPPADGELGAETPERGPRPDVQAAVTVIERRNPRHDHERVNLTGANLARADLQDANLTHANLFRADPTGANLIIADLTAAFLSQADLTTAGLVHTGLTGAYVADADLTDADLSDARWPRNAVVPESWQRDLSSGRLKRTDINLGDAPTDLAPAASALTAWLVPRPVPE